MENKKELLDNLFEEWQDRQKAEPEETWNKTKGYTQHITREKFCFDGIIDEETFEKQKLKVLFISNESNDDTNGPGGNRCEEFKRYFNDGIEDWGGKLKERACALYQVVSNNYSVPINKVAKNFAFMNLNKRAGKKNVGDAKHIEAYVEHYRCSIKREIEIIDPDIIIWLSAKTFDMNLHTEYLGATKKDGKVYFNGKIPIVRMWHTSATKCKYRRLGKFDNQNLDKLAAKLSDELEKYDFNHAR